MCLNWGIGREIKICAQISKLQYSRHCLPKRRRDTLPTYLSHPWVLFFKKIPAFGFNGKHLGYTVSLLWKVSASCGMQKLQVWPRSLQCCQSSVLEMFEHSSLTCLPVLFFGKGAMTSLHPWAFWSSWTFCPLGLPGCSQYLWRVRSTIRSRVRQSLQRLAKKQTNHALLLQGLRLWQDTELNTSCPRYRCGNTQYCSNTHLCTLSPMLRLHTVHKQRALQKNTF